MFNTDPRTHSVASESAGATSVGPLVNGIDTTAFMAAGAAMVSDPSLAPVHFSAKSTWQGGLRSQTEIESYQLGERTIARRHVIRSDEPNEILGSNTAPNPQDLLLAALNACMLVGFVAAATKRGIEVQHLCIQSSLGFDLRGAFGLDASLKPGAELIRYRLEVKAKASPEQLAEVHEEMKMTSPNRWHLSQPMRFDAEFVVR
ncbi:MAG TPA: OsmC family protein [Polyangiaceae bacterium]|nr:OsmC family protein [Polyangiaceae bacterium]